MSYTEADLNTFTDIDAINAMIEHKRSQIQDMFGQLYPSILAGEIGQLIIRKKELYEIRRRNHGRSPQT